jgi:hypothetical protein
LFVYREGDPYGAWPVDMGAAENSLLVNLSGTSQCWDEAQEGADADTRSAMRGLLESWVGPDYVYGEAFDGRVMAPPAPGILPPEPSADAGTISRGAECERACAAAAAAGCGDGWSCETDICWIRNTVPGCEPEGDAYLGCLGTLDAVAFTCMDGKPQLISYDCNDPYLDAWARCTGR